MDTGRDVLASEECRDCGSYIGRAGESGFLKGMTGRCWRCTSLELDRQREAKWTRRGKSIHIVKMDPPAYAYFLRASHRIDVESPVKPERGSMVKVCEIGSDARTYVMVASVTPLPKTTRTYRIRTEKL